MLRKSLLAHVAASALAAGSISVGGQALAQSFPMPGVQAHVDLYGGFGALNWNDTDSGFAFGGAGRANAPLMDRWNLQLDAQGSAFVFSGGKSAPQFGGYAHLYRRDPSNHAFGVFGGANYAREGGSTYQFGLEGQKYWEQFTFYVQGSVLSLHDGPVDGWGLQLRKEGQWFLTDDTALLGDVMWTYTDVDGQGGNTLTLAGTLMHRFNGGPFSGFLQGRYDGFENQYVSVDQWSAVAGVRVSADALGSTDKSHRRTGAGMDVLQAPIYGFSGPLLASDRRLKRDVKLLRRLANGIGLYRYRYVWSDTVYVGVMAQEVATIVPDAVVQGADGYLRVDYGRLGISLMTWGQWLAANRAGELAAAA